MNIEQRLKNILDTSEKKISLGESFYSAVAQDIEKQFQKIKKAELESIKFDDMQYALRWHNVLNVTGLTDKSSRSKLGMFFDMIIDFYSSESHNCIAAMSTDRVIQ